MRIPQIAAAALVLAGAHAQTIYSVTLYQKSALNGTEFERGQCKLIVRDSNVEVVQGKRKAEVPARIESSNSKFADTSVTYHDGQIHEVRFGGTTTKLLIERAQ